MQLNIPAAGTDEFIEFLRTNVEAFKKLPSDTFTKDGLVKFSDLVSVSGDNLFPFYLKKQENIYVIPEFYVKEISSYLEKNKSKKWHSEIRVRPRISVAFSAPLFGVPFAKAVQHALEGEYVKAQFVLLNENNSGINMRLLLHVNRRKESNHGVVQLQAWQYIDGDSRVFYLHAESKDFCEFVSHFDGALITMTSSQTNSLFKMCDKIKGEKYEKQFRLDGEIPMKDFYSISRLFLPNEELICEAFELSEYVT